MMVTINHMDFSTWKNQKLNAESPGGSSHVEITSEQVVVNTIQDTSQFKLERPSGKIVDLDNKKLYQDIRSRGYAIRYHAIVPMLTTYIFNRQEKTLTIRYKGQPPRMTSNRSWVSLPTQKEVRYNPKTNRSYAKSTKDLDKEGAMRAFPPGFSEEHYRKCEKQDGLMAQLWHTISKFLFP